MALLVADTFGAASHRAMDAHLCGPFQAGAVDTPLEVAADGTVAIKMAARESVLLIAPKVALDDRWMDVTAILDPAGAAIPIAPPLAFAPYTEAGAFLPLLAPAVDPDLRTSPPFTVQLSVAFRDRDGAPLAVPPGDPSTFLEARLSEGVLGKVLYAAGAEKARLRRQLREVSAMRTLSAARWDALDRRGAELGVPRFTDRLAYDAALKEIYTEVVKVDGRPVPEADATYRRRLLLRAPWLMPTRRRVVELLNGPGGDAAPNAGPLGEMGLAARFHVEERNNPFAIAVHVAVAAGHAAARPNFDEYLRKNLLVWPAAFAVNDPHEHRLLGTSQRQRLEALRASLRASFTVTQAVALAPALADALDRAGRLRASLGAPGKVTIARAFDPAAGSRYELGLGADIQPLAAAELDAMHAALTGGAPPVSPDPEIQALIDALDAKPAADDPDGAWLFQAAGLLTVHRVSGATVYLSPLPTFGLVVAESAVQPGGGLLALEAHYHAPGDPGANAVVEAALTDGAAAWAAGGHEAWTRLTDADTKAKWNANTAQPVAVRNLFTAAGLPAVASLPAIATALNNLPEELIGGIQLGPVLSGRIVANDVAAIPELTALADLFRDQHLAAILPFVSGANQITVLVSAVGLPQAGVNLSDRLSAGFRWYAAPIDGGGGEIKTVGARSLFRPAGSAVLTLVVVIGYARRGLVDPYEFRVELPDEALLTLEQYEYVMNLLERVCPVGVLANTYTLRQRHVDLDLDGAADPLPPSLFRTYRKFHRPHLRGELIADAPDA